MILENRSKPTPLKKLDAVLPRLSPHSKKENELEVESRLRYKGYIGEIKVDGYINTHFEKQYTILHDITLKIDGKETQIDSIIITPHAIYILEIKNYNGTIIFNTILHQFTRDDGKIETGFRHPITQAETNKLKLKHWLYERKLHHVPVHYFVAISEPSTLIRVIGDEKLIAKVVAHGEHIPKKIMQMETQYQKETPAKLQHRKMGAAILKESYDFDFNILGKYGVIRADILPGVHCPKCGFLGMDRRHTNWKCKKCDNKYKYAHLRAIKDYFLLINSSLSNKECRWFLQLHSRSVATRILQNSGLEYNAKRKRWYKKD